MITISESEMIPGVVSVGLDSTCVWTYPTVSALAILAPYAVCGFSRRVREVERNAQTCDKAEVLPGRKDLRKRC